MRERVRVERRAQLALRYRTLTEALARLLPDWRWSEPLGGSSLWIELPSGDSAAFARAAERYGVTLAPGAAFSMTDRHANRLRLPFVLDPTDLREGVARLVLAWNAFAGGTVVLARDAIV